MLNGIGSELRESGRLTEVVLLPLFHSEQPELDTARVSLRCGFFRFHSPPLNSRFLSFLWKIVRKSFFKGVLCAISGPLLQTKGALKPGKQFRIFRPAPTSGEVVVSRDVWRIFIYFCFFFCKSFGCWWSSRWSGSSATCATYANMFYVYIYSWLIKSTWAICRPKRAACNIFFSTEVDSWMPRWRKGSAANAK